MKRKVLSSVLAMLIGASAMVGCATTTVEESEPQSGSADVQTAQTEEKKDESSSTTLTGEGDETLHVFLYMQEHEKAIYQKLIDEFVEAHKDKIKEVVFEVTTQDEYNQKMIANMTAGDMPDVFYVGPAAVRSYVDNGYIMPLDQYVDDATISSIWGTTQEIYRYDGKNIGTGSLYAFPKDLSCFAFAYNQDLFDAAGLEYPDPDKPYTYDEFVEVCKALTKDTDGDGEIDQWGVANADQFGMTPFLYSNGVKFLNEDMTKVNVANNQQLKEALTFYTDLTKNGLTPSVEQDTALGGYQRWLDGQIGFYACGTWDVGAFMDKNTFPYQWGLCGWPTGKTGVSMTRNGSVGFAVSKDSKVPEAAAKLITLFSTDLEGQRVLSGETTGASLQIPNIMDYAKGDFKAKIADGTIPYGDNVDVIFNYIEGTDKYRGLFVETNYTYNADWWSEFLSGGYEYVLKGEKTAAEYCHEVQPAMQAALDNAIELQKAAEN